MRLLLPQSDAERPERVRLVEPAQSDRVEAVFQPLNPLGGNVPVLPDPSVDRLVVWSGTPAAAIDDADPRTWTGQAMNDFNRWCDDLLAADDRPARISFRLHARHVLSDVPGARRFLLDRDGQLGITLSPATMLEPSMVATLVEHLERFFEELGSRADFIWLGDCVPDETTGWMRAVPLGQGVMPQAVVRALLAEHVPEETPVVVDAPDVGSARRWLSM